MIAASHIYVNKYLTIKWKRGHPWKGFYPGKKTFRSKKSQIFCIIKQNNSMSHKHSPH